MAYKFHDGHAMDENEFARARADFDGRERAAREAAIADRQAVWVLADLSIPEDFKTFARTVGVPQLAGEMFRVAFILGWRAHDKAMKDEEFKQEYPIK